MKKEFWFIVGSQDLYGEEVLRTVAKRAQEMATELSKVLPYPLVYVKTLRGNSNSGILRISKLCMSFIVSSGVSFLVRF